MTAGMIEWQRKKKRKPSAISGHLKPGVGGADTLPPEDEAFNRSRSPDTESPNKVVSALPCSARFLASQAPESSAWLNLKSRRDLEPPGLNF
ncbi:hypothetical protein HA402_009537 [Bradysia odoriphaga]|nr:hypothetical protein HA402_009537 [Bradysia odoriphaga]